MVAPVTTGDFMIVFIRNVICKPCKKNASGYDENSPINHVDKLKGKYL
jgi:dipeptidyl-peptidase-4